MVVFSLSSIVSFSPLVVLVMMTVLFRMGTPSRVKGGLQEMKKEVELMGTTVRLLTDSNGPADNNYDNCMCIMAGQKGCICKTLFYMGTMSVLSCVTVCFQLRSKTSTVCYIHQHTASQTTVQNIAPKIPIERSNGVTMSSMILKIAHFGGGIL